MHHRTLRRLSGVVTTIVVTAGLLMTTAVAGHATGPANDNFGSAAALSTASGLQMIIGTTVGATTEPGEPSHAPDEVTPTSGSIWYSFTAPSDGNLSVGVTGTVGFDPVVAVYQGGAVASLTRLAANDDQRPESTQAFVGSLPVVAQATYRIAIAGKAAQQSVVQLMYTFTPRPRNDDPIQSVAVYENFTSQGWNVHATADPGEPALTPSQVPSKTVWWYFHPVHNGTLSLNTFGSSFDTVLAVFRQDSPTLSYDGLTRLAFNDDASPGTSGSAVTDLDVKVGEDYWVAVDGYNGAQGAVKVTTSWVQSPHPDNDDFADALAVQDGTVLDGSTATATTEAGEPDHSSSYVTGKSVWYRFTPSTDSAVTVDLTGSTFDTGVALYRGTSMADLVRVADDRGKGATPARPTRISRVPVQAGQGYYLAIAGIGGDSGTVAGTFRITPRPTVTSLSASGGPLVGGNWIQIHGTDLAGAATAVTIGSTPVKPVEVDLADAHQVIQFRVPSGLPAGPLPVKVATDGGVAAFQPTYVVGQPTVGSMSRSYARLTGGEAVVLTGTELSGTPIVKVGGATATGVTKLSPTSLSFVTPKQGAGTFPVTVQTAAGTAVAGSLTYLPPPTVTKLSRTAGPHRGGYAVKISGSGLVAVSKVLVGSRAASFSLVGGKLIVTVPKGRPGRTVYIRVVTPGGTSAAVKVARFRYR